MKLSYIKKTITVFCVSCIVVHLQAQCVGINTNTPTAALDIVSSGNTSSTQAMIITNTEPRRIFTLLDNHKLGLGVVNPLVGLDLRAKFPSGSPINGAVLGLGKTTLAASAVGGGAIRYESTSKTLQYSNGTEWLILQNDIPRPIVAAKMDSTTVKLVNNTETVIKGWEPVYDTTKSFNLATGVFTAPKQGLYTICMSLLIVALANDKPIQGNTYVETRFKTNSGASIKCRTTFAKKMNSYIPVFCSGSFDLNEGDTLQALIYQNTGFDRILRNYWNEDGTSTPNGLQFNAISIVLAI